MKPEELEYKGDKIIKYGKNDYVGFYWGVYGPDGDMEEVHATSYEEVCKKLDECNAIVRGVKEKHQFLEETFKICDNGVRKIKNELEVKGLLTH